MPTIAGMTWFSLAASLVTVALFIVVMARKSLRSDIWYRDPRNLLGLACRVALGGVLLWAGISKVGALDTSVQLVREYKILPTYDLVKLVGNVLPIGELILGALILAGVFTRITAALGGVLMVAYIAAIVSLPPRGIWMDCGCGGEEASALEKSEALIGYAIDVVRDLLLLGAAVWLFRHPQSKPSVDQWLLRPIDETAPTAEASAPAEVADAAASAPSNAGARQKKTPPQPAARRKKAASRK
jgi:uncharacterized membrane protein YphA (DoxX/SURF4 family)